MSREDFYNSTATVQRFTRVADGHSGSDKTWANLATGIKCCIQPRSGKELVMHDKTTEVISHKMYCETRDIKARDRIVDQNSVTYKILAVRNIDLLDEFITLDLQEEN